MVASVAIAVVGDVFGPAVSAVDAGAGVRGGTCVVVVALVTAMPATSSDKVAARGV